MNDEIAAFLAELRADRAATKDKEKREAWTKFTSLSIVCIAVLATVASQFSGKFSGHASGNLSEATYNQTEAADQWSYYQAKAIKQAITEGELDAAVRTGDVKTATELKAKLARYGKEKEAIAEKARGFEHTRDQLRSEAGYFSKKGGEMSLAVSLFQISIAVASICLVMKKKYLWHISTLLAFLAVLQMIHAWRL